MCIQYDSWNSKLCGQSILFCVVIVKRRSAGVSWVVGSSILFCRMDYDAVQLCTSSWPPAPVSAVPASSRAASSSPVTASRHASGLSLKKQHSRIWKCSRIFKNLIQNLQRLSLHNSNNKHQYCRLGSSRIFFLGGEGICEGWQKGDLEWPWTTETHHITL